MSELKMSDVFNLPMLCEDGDGYIYSNDCRYSILFDDTDTSCMRQKHAVTNAINSYDRNQELIAEQASEIEMLRELFKPLMREAQACQNVLHSLAHNGQVCWDYSVDAKKVLEATELALADTANGEDK